MTMEGTPPKPPAKPPTKTPAKPPTTTPAKSLARTPAKPPAKTPAKPPAKKPTEKKKSKPSAAEKKKSPRSVAANKKKRHKPSGGVSALVKNKLRAPVYTILAVRIKSGELLSVASARAEEKVSHWHASMSYRLYAWHPFPTLSRVIRRVAAKQAMENKKLAASEKRAQKVFTANSVAHGKRSKAYETRAAQLSEAVV